MNNNKTCDFCKELNSNEAFFNDWASNRLSNRIISESKNFVLIPAIGQLIKGHVMIVSKKHFTSISSLSEDLVYELTEFFNVVKQKISDIYSNNIVFFEHGVPNDIGCNGGCGVYHLHLHCLPVYSNNNILVDLLGDESFNRINDFSGLLNSYRSYLLIIDNNKKFFVKEIEWLESQFMRKYIASKLQIEDWDWRNSKIDANFINTYNELNIQFGINSLT